MKKKEILEFNLKRLLTTLHFENLSIDQNTRERDFVFFKIKELIKSVNCDRVNKIYSTTAVEEENDRALKIFNLLKIDTYIEEMIEKLEDTEEENIEEFSNNILRQIEIYRKMFITNISKNNNK